MLATGRLGLAVAQIITGSICPANLGTKLWQ